MLKTHSPWVPHGRVAMRKQGRGSAWGPWAHRDVPGHEATQLLLAAGGDFSPCWAPELPRCQQTGCVPWLFHAGKSVGTARVKMWGGLWQGTFNSARINTPPSKRGMRDHCILFQGTCPFEERPNTTTVGGDGCLSSTKPCPSLFWLSLGLRGHPPRYQQAICRAKQSSVWIVHVPSKLASEAFIFWVQSPAFSGCLTGLSRLSVPRWVWGRSSSGCCSTAIPWCLGAD